MANKKPRRGRGEGSIYQRKDGRYVASLPIEGQGRKRKYFYGKTRTEVREKLQKAQLEQRQGKLATGPQQTLQQFTEHWLEDIRKPHIRVNTYRTYRQMLDRHIIPELGHIRLQKLSPQHIDELYARKLQDGYAAETVRQIHRVLHRALRDAVRWNLMSLNVCDNVAQPRAVKYESHPLSGEQAKHLLAAIKGDRLETLLILALVTGMRQGELLSLRWSEIDFQERSLWVRHTVNRAGRYGIIENDPKTESSKRKIMLPQFAIDTLRQQQERQAEMRKRAGESWKEQNIVFSNRYGGFLEGPNLDRRLKQLLKQAGLPDMRFHDLRHSAATILLKMGVHPKQVQELLGHSSITITMDLYSHVLPSMQVEMMDKLDDFFGER